MTRIKIFKKSGIISQKRLQKFSHNINNVEKFIILETLIFRNNSLTPGNKDKDRPIIIIKLDLYNSSLQNIIIKDFFTLDLYFTNKIKNLFYKVFLYLL